MSRPSKRLPVPAPYTGRRKGSEREENPMKNLLNEQAVSALAELPLHELSYCLKLAKRFETLGIEGERASSALCSIIDAGVVGAARE